MHDVEPAGGALCFSEATLADEATGGCQPVTAQHLEKNSILKGVDASIASSIVGCCKVVDLSLRQRIYAPEQLSKEVHFPLTAVLSIVTRMKDGSQIEVGTVGREGTSGFPLLMGAESSANDCYCQVRGSSIVIAATLFRDLSVNNPQFRQLLDRYLQAYVNMLGQLAACNRLHSIYERCSRWLLLTHDRFDSDKIPLTHEFLAMMLGTNRSGVTIAAATLQRAGFISYTFGPSGFLIVAALKLRPANATRLPASNSLVCYAASLPSGEGSTLRTRPTAFIDKGGVMVYAKRLSLRTEATLAVTHGCEYESQGRLFAQCRLRKRLRQRSTMPLSRRS